MERSMLVIPPTALITMTGSRSIRSFTRERTLSMHSALPRDVPPNFITIMVRPCVVWMMRDALIHNVYVYLSETLLQKENVLAVLLAFTS